MTNGHSETVWKLWLHHTCVIIWLHKGVDGIYSTYAEQSSNHASSSWLSGSDTAPQMHFNQAVREGKKDFPGYLIPDFISIFSPIKRGRRNYWESHASRRYVTSLKWKSNHLCPPLKSKQTLFKPNSIIGLHLIHQPIWVHWVSKVNKVLRSAIVFLIVSLVNSAPGWM